MRDSTGGGGRVTIVGAGPAGLFLARTVRLRSPGTVVDVYDRLGAAGASGFGVSLSERTLRAVAEHDPETHQLITAASVAQRGITVRLASRSVTYPGFEVSTISRHALLSVLRDQADAAGARLHYGHELQPGEASGDVVAVADGTASTHRDALRQEFGTRTRTGAARFIWLGTTADIGDTAVMAFERTSAGPMAVHMYAYGGGMSTVVVEMDDDTWRRAGLDQAVQPSGAIDAKALAFLAGVFAVPLKGCPLISAASRWRRFTVVENARWSHGATVLLGDAAHTAHFTVGSGTKLALEDALALGAALSTHERPADAFAEYERRRRPAVGRTQRWAAPSMRWWETYGTRLHLPVEQFGLNFLTRTPAMTYPALRRRCPQRLEEAETAFRRAAGEREPADSGNAVTTPLSIAGLRIAGRLAVPAAPGPVPRTGTMRPGPGGLVLLGEQITPHRFATLYCGSAVEVLLNRARVLRRHGVSLFLVLADLGRTGWWERTLHDAELIRARTGTPVAVAVPSGWEYDLARDVTVDPWPYRIHLALIAGRIDLVVPLPLPAAQREQA
ncbi:FAD-dependent monooxygenase [Actinoplanes auranticolor]|uniref:FAD-binding domain-containing protein n=1 Tax=Actinoplanes auranticolor TaxID=47988 RepID=A0A919SLV6_9ACTN|nr:FAD-dependent monooxygenase [Actinoplanes auranticolor]GIM74450.1 hypothetical protein Aau02nite_61030 [Actinoplanes auranticolor]